MDQLAQNLLNGLVLGSTYTLVAIGFTLVFGVMHVINLAHGELFMIGAFTTYYLVSGTGLHLFVALPLAMVVGGIASVMLARLVFQPLQRRGGSDFQVLLAAIGVVMVSENGTLHLLGSAPRSLSQVLGGTIYRFAGLSLSIERLTILVVSTILMLGLLGLVRFTRMGRALRGSAQDAVAAGLVGIDVERIYLAAFAVAGGLAAAAGGLLGVVFVVGPMMGLSAALKSFIVVVLGGMGSVPGAILGGYLLGMAESLGTVYIASWATDIISFAFLVAVLLLRPQGLLGRSVR